jgi:hypothetical protein
MLASRSGGCRQRLEQLRWRLRTNSCLSCLPSSFYGTHAAAAAAAEGSKGANQLILGLPTSKSGGGEEGDAANLVLVL